jgi:adenine-specific DNA methylase
LKIWFNPNPTRYIENSEEIILEKAEIALNLIDSLKEPETFEDACYHPNFEERMKWREEISKKIVEMNEKGVYETI